eukprot:TRINITY_DN6231_c0_g1_i4.p1 TRINITY_DN6231_c0_g1~~TRINITY_DN6231_c0_g1_i4.p1  ORF type:complete len:694 (-),score=150.70 TRINITY_DN6231_c0_g1_i4:355-2436(-)
MARRTSLARQCALAKLSLVGLAGDNHLPRCKMPGSPHRRHRPSLLRHGQHLVLAGRRGHSVGSSRSGRAAQARRRAHHRAVRAVAATRRRRGERRVQGRCGARSSEAAVLGDARGPRKPDAPGLAHHGGRIHGAAGSGGRAGAHPALHGDDGGGGGRQGGEADFRPAAVRLVGAAIVCAIFTGVRGGLFTLVGSRVNVRIRQMLFDSLVRQEIGFFDTTKTGEITSRLSADCTKVGDQVCLNINLFLRNFVQAAGTLLFMFYLSWRLSTVAFVSVPAIVGVSRYYGHFIRDLAKQVQERLAEANAVAEEALGSMTTVRSFAAEGRESAAYGARLHDYYALAIREAAAYGAYASTAALLPQLVTVLVLFYGGRMVLAGQLDGGSVVAFMLYLSSLSDGFNNMGAIFSSITQAVGAADKVFELIRREPQVRKPRGGAALRPLECAGELTLEEVHFTYPARPTRPVLHGVNLVVRPGQVLALVGPSGGGKSSCVSLIENFYHPDQGRLLLDGTPVQDLDHRWYHRVVSLVGQEPVLYGRTIEQNILYGLEGDADEPTHADVVAAARLANAHAFIDALPHGYDTQVGQRGVQMSGGPAAGRGDVRAGRGERVPRAGGHQQDDAHGHDRRDHCAPPEHHQERGRDRGGARGARRGAGLALRAAGRGRRLRGPGGAPAGRRHRMTAQRGGAAVLRGAHT